MSDETTLSDPSGPQEGESLPEAAVATAKATYQWTPVRMLVAAILMGGILGPLAYYVYRSVGVAGSRGGGAGVGFPAGLRRSGRGSLLDQYNLDNLILPRDQINPGGPWKDQIPSLTDPRTIPVSKATLIDKQSRVIVVTINGQTRGYPLAILSWHEAINDQLGQVPVAVIYCPLCDSVSVVDRRMGEKTLEFGISGLLCYSNVLLYDRTDQALWSQVAMKAVSGPHSGQALKHLTGWKIMRMGDFAAQYADATVLSTNTGHNRSYARNPYAGYFTNDRVMGNFATFTLDTRYKNKARIVGIEHDGISRAYMLDEIQKAPDGLVQDTIHGSAVRLQYNATSDTLQVLEAPPGASAVYTFWFAWAKFHPDTQIYAIK